MAVSERSAEAVGSCAPGFLKFKPPGGGVQRRFVALHSHALAAYASEEAHAWARERNAVAVS